MTNITLRAPAQSSRFTGNVVDFLMGATLALAGVLSLAIFVACLGLFGLVTYAAEQRTKEVGIRKVLGASVQNIVTLLSRDFIGLVVVSILIAFPAAWWAMHNWLQGFAYKINLSWWLFAASAGIALFIALVTVSFQAVKAALVNPVKSLRSE